MADLSGGVLRSIREYEKNTGTKFRIMLIQHKARQHNFKVENYPDLDIYLEIDLDKPEDIEKALLPYRSEIVAVTSRSESHMTDFVAVIPNVPYLNTPTTESLCWATDKLLMRRRFMAYDKKISPNYALVKDTSETELARVITKIGFPMVVKPTNLAQSLLVSVCHHEAELKAALKKGFSEIQKLYQKYGRYEEPRILVEEFMDGQMYSVDVYVSPKGTTYFCPMVRVKTGREVGFDDFFGYLQLSPPKLSKQSIDLAHDVARKGIYALGLRSVTAHVELMRIDNDWKVIEIGARVGGFRMSLHKYTHGINHVMNDVLVRMGKRPVLPKRQFASAAAMRIYGKKEGVIKSIRGVSKLKTLASFKSLAQGKRTGDKNIFAKNGGKSVLSIILAHENRSQLLADIRRVEELFKIEID
ncbi:MAG: hypothetical protein RLZZ70_840 [Candidatus Parcubacteria bacterium]